MRPGLVECVVALGMLACACSGTAGDGEDAATDGTGTDGGTTGGGPESCGDGIIDADEQCDDANDQADDGCTRCQLDEPPGDATWRVDLPGFPAWNRGHVDPVLIGFFDGETWGVARYDATGQQTLIREFSDPTGLTVNAVADDANGTIVVGGQTEDDLPWGAVYDVATDELRTLALEPRPTGEVQNVAIDGAGRLLVGTIVQEPTQTGWFDQLDSDDSVRWSVEGFALWHGVALGRDDEVALALGKPGAPVRLHAADGSELWTSDTPVDDQAVSHRASTIWTPDGGDTYVVFGADDRWDGESPTVIWVREYDRAGSILWTTRLPDLHDPGQLVTPMTVLYDGRVPILSPPDWDTVRLLDAAGVVQWNKPYPGDGRPLGLLPLGTDAIGMIRMSGLDYALERHTL